MGRPAKALIVSKRSVGSNPTLSATVISAEVVDRPNPVWFGLLHFRTPENGREPRPPRRGSLIRRCSAYHISPSRARIDLLQFDDSGYKQLVTKALR